MVRMSGVARVLLWVAAFPAGALLGRFVFGESWPHSLEAGVLAVLATGLTFLLDIARKRP
jgi:hypothetical protein